MAIVVPFRAMRFDEKKSGEIAKLCCPPYDIISPAQREAYIAANDHNVVRLELPVGENRYENAAAILNEWLDEGALKLDDKDSFYIYGEEFTVEDTAYSFCGVIGRIKLTPFSEGVVLPHEETLSKAKEDRLNLMKATGCNFSQIYSLYNDDEGENCTADLLKSITAGAPVHEFADGDGVTHCLWIVDDPALTAKLSNQFSGRKLYIADGHHRYETALNYKNYLLESGKEITDQSPESYVMMFLVDMADPGLVVFPTHRIVRDLPDFDLDSLLDACDEHFDVYTLCSCCGYKDAMDQQYSLGKKAYVLCSGGERFLLVYKDDGAMEEAVKDRSDAYRDLDVSVLHSLILERALGIDKENMAKQINLTYTRDAEEAEAATEEGRANCAFILNPTRISQIAAVAAAGDKMPQKSTYFYPKLITGLVMNKF